MIRDFQNLNLSIKRSGLVVASFAVCLWICVHPVLGQPMSGQNNSGTSGREFRREAIAALPLQDLTPAAQRKIAAVLDQVSLYRRLPVSAIESDPDFFVLLARYPEIVVETWRLMGISQMTCERTGPFTLRSDDGAGTASEIELVYGTGNLHLYYATGTYSGNLFHRPVDAECVMLLRTSYSPAPSGGVKATNTLDVFIKIDNALVGMAAKTLLPLVGRTADQNFVESLKFVERLNSTTEKNGPGVQGMAWRLEGLDDEVRRQFIESAGVVHDRALKRQNQSAQNPGARPPGAGASLSDGISVGDASAGRPGFSR